MEALGLKIKGLNKRVQRDLTAPYEPVIYGSETHSAGELFLNFFGTFLALPPFKTTVHKSEAARAKIKKTYIPSGVRFLSVQLVPLQ